MAEREISFVANGLQLEGLLDERPGEGAMVATHPHPLYGGDLHNNVVSTVCAAYRKSGYTTLRFNFRGVGRSEGSYDSGRGEQEDVRAAVGYLADLGKKRIDLAGYSFGAWVAARGLNRFDEVKRVILVSPPVDFMSFSGLKEDSRIQLVIAGERDDFGKPDTIERMIAGWNKAAKLKIIPGADHFYWDKTGEIEIIIRKFLEGQLSAVGKNSKNS